MDDPKLPLSIRYMRPVLMFGTGISIGILARILVGTSAWHEMIAPILICSGGWLNYTAMSANGMRMPVFPKCVSECPCHISGDGNTKYPWLCDRIPMGIVISSIGDVLCYFGILAVIWESIYG